MWFVISHNGNVNVLIHIFHQKTIKIQFCKYIKKHIIKSISQLFLFPRPLNYTTHRLNYQFVYQLNQFFVDIAFCHFRILQRMESQTL